VASFIPTLYAGSRPDTGPKLLGGASAGAIAAAFAAAAERGRTNHGSSVIADVETAANQASSGFAAAARGSGRVGHESGRALPAITEDQGLLSAPDGVAKTGEAQAE
jgi:hypothetical protein